MALPSRNLATITIPDTPLVKTAITYARQHLSDDTAYNHIMRAFLLSSALVSHLPPSHKSTLDLEALAIGTILHDLGWSKSPELISKDKCFEVDGANAARAFLLREANREEWDKHRIQLVWDIIGLHTTPQIAAHKEPEVALASLGIFIELFGVEVGKQMMGDMVSVTQEEFDAVAKEFPREGLRGYMKDVICGFCREKPETTYLGWQGEFGERFVEGYSLEGKRAVDLMMTHLTE